MKLSPRQEAVLQARLMIISDAYSVRDALSEEKRDALRLIEDGLRTLAQLKAEFVK